MNHSLARNLTLVGASLLVLGLLLMGGRSVTAGPAPAVHAQPVAAPGTDSQGRERSTPDVPGEPLDDESKFPDAAAASFYHIPGSVLTPVSSATTLSYGFMGCIYATAGAGNLLNAPLELPDGARVVLVRLYYDDASTSSIDAWLTRYDELGTTYEDLIHIASTGSSGHGSSYGELDHVVNTYSWSYVLNVRLNAADTNLQVCGLRVMYYAPGTTNYLPAVMRNAQP